VRRALAALAVILLLGGACTGGESPRSSARSPGRTTGGTLRLISYQDAYEFDPQLSYSSVEWELFRCCLLRTLMSYSGMPTRDGGAEVRPDLADAMPRISADGLTWTFRIKRGIRYGPPLGRTQVVAGDFIRALEREARVAPPGFTPASYYSVIRGFDAYRHRSADSISGLHAPDDHTLVVDLTRDTGDLGYRLSLPASAPIPPLPRDAMSRFGVATGHPDVGAFLVASGPYMIEGSQALDFTRPADEQRRVAGLRDQRFGQDGAFTGGFLHLVRNPFWDPTTDDLRGGFVDRIDLALGPPKIDFTKPNAFVRALNRSFQDVAVGNLDMVLNLDPPIQQMGRIRGDPKLVKRLQIDTNGTVDYVSMNLAVPPFDDIHVREALSLAVEKAAMQRTLIAEGYGVETNLASHLVPDSLEEELLAGYRPPWDTAGAQGDLRSARAAMRQSKYDSNDDGRCDATACRHVRMIVDQPWPHAFDGVLRRDMKALGMTLSVSRFPKDIYAQREQPPGRWALNANRWAVDYPNASDVFPVLFGGHTLSDPITYNTSLLGATREQLNRWGYSVTNVPSVDRRIDQCVMETGRDQVACWANVDKHLMEEVVPWIPFLFEDVTRLVSARVAHYSFDQFMNLPAPDQIALTPAAIAEDSP